MRINGSLVQQKNPFLNVESVNRGLSKDTVNAVKKGIRNDKVQLSAQGKMMSAIEQLVKQKENIREQKNQLISRTIEDGGNMKTIESQLDIYEEKLKDIDDQISKINKQQLTINPQKEDEKKTKKKEKTDETKTEEQIETEKLSKLANATDSIKQSEVISSVKDKVEGKVDVINAQLEVDELSIDVLYSKGLLSGADVQDMIDTIQESIDQKEDVLSNLNEQVMDLDLQQAINTKDSNSKIEDYKKDSTLDVNNPNNTENEKLELNKIQ